MPSDSSKLRSGAFFGFFRPQSSAAVVRDVLIVSSTFPPVIGGSSVVYSQLCSNAPDRIVGLGPSKDYETGNVLPGTAELDAKAPYIMRRLDYLRPPVSTKPKGRILRLWSIFVDDLPVMIRAFFFVAALTNYYRVKVVCVGELIDHGWLVLPVRYLLGRKVILYTHGEEIASSSVRLLGRLRGYFLRQADAIISVSQFCKDGIVSNYGISPSKIHVVSNGVDLETFCKGERDRTVFAPKIRDRVIILSVSRLVERKGQEFLIRAMPDILREIPQAQCVIVGAGPLESFLKDLTAKLKLDDSVSFQGSVPLDELVRFYRAADVFVLPCRTMPDNSTEGFGLVFLEANACGMPVVAGAAGGTVEAVIDGKTGLLVDGTNVQEISTAVKRILRDPEFAKQLADGGWRRAQDVGWSKVAQQFLGVCQETLEDKPTQRNSAVTSPQYVHPGNAETGSPISASILDNRFRTPIFLPQTEPPLLITTVDAEESFDWSRPFSSATRDVSSMAHQHLAHRLFDRYGVIPTYLVDFPVASQPQGYLPLLDFLRDGKCEIGAQLHPWVNPPMIEDVNVSNSFPGNLPPDLEFEKLRILTDTIEQAFGVRPRVYRAGRSGVGKSTGETLKRLGYLIDTSVVPERSFTYENGPNFFGFPSDPWWFDVDRTLLELPISSAVTGPLRPPPRLAPLLFETHAGRRIIPAILARSGMADRIKLTPEGISAEAAKKLIKAMLARGTRVFTLSYHSPSLTPGATPYVRTAADLERLLRWLDNIFEFFFGEIGGKAATPWTVYERLFKPEFRFGTATTDCSRPS